MGAEPLIEEDGDKPTVVALREIAEGLVTLENITKLNIGSYEEDISLEFAPTE
jgi:DNA-directed RNA polymerase subunit omega